MHWSVVIRLWKSWWIPSRGMAWDAVGSPTSWSFPGEIWNPPLCSEGRERQKKQEATPGWEVADLTSKENLHTRLILDHRKMRKKNFFCNRNLFYFFQIKIQSVHVLQILPQSNISVQSTVCSIRLVSTDLYPQCSVGSSSVHLA